MASWSDQELTSKMIAAAIEVHRHLGPGLLEIADQTCLAAELEDRGLKYQREVIVPLTYKNRKLDCGFRAGKLQEESFDIDSQNLQEVFGTPPRELSFIGNSQLF